MESGAMELVIGDKRWSSWSLRPWLALRRTGEPFRETTVRLRRADTADAIAASGSPSGLVPLLKADGVVVWDSLAICEHLAERFPASTLWPADARARALARAAACEMHAGYAALRREHPMEPGLRTAAPVSQDVAADLRRIVSLWSDLRGRYRDRGPYLVGDWSIADAFFTPVATRLRSYGIDLAAYGDASGAAQAYAATLLAEPDFLAWEGAARAEEG